MATKTVSINVLPKTKERFKKFKMEYTLREDEDVTEDMMINLLMDWAKNKKIKVLKGGK